MVMNLQYFLRYKDSCNTRCIIADKIMRNKVESHPHNSKLRDIATRPLINVILISQQLYAVSLYTLVDIYTYMAIDSNFYVTLVFL